MKPKMDKWDEWPAGHAKKNYAWLYSKAKEKIYVCGDRPSLLQDLAFAIFKANMMEPRRFQCRKYTRNDR